MRTDNGVSMGNRLRTETEVERLRSRWELPEFAPARDALLTRADSGLAADLRPVDRGAGWGHAYYCPDHAVPLRFDPSEPHRHVCPVDEAVYEGAAFDGGWRCMLNARILDGIRAAALAWRATGDTGYRTHAVGLLLAYAELYPQLPPLGEHVGLGRVTGQSLEEAAWAIGIAQAFDDVRDSLSAAEFDEIRTGLLTELTTHLTSQLMGKIHNIECWHLAALATLGTVLGDETVVTRSVEGEFGLLAQLAEGILEDGWWAEGSPHYHYYMLASALTAVTALRAQGPGSLDVPRLRSMLTAPLSLLRADYSLPALNDGWNNLSKPLGVASYVALYEQAYGLWNDETVAHFLRAMYDRDVARTSEQALTMGPDLSAATSRRWTRRNVHPASGYAILADGTGADERFLLLKYGPHGGGHGHPDKLQLDVHAFGVRLAPDAGSPAYNSPLQGPWYRQTLSHNTVVLGEESQPEAEGRLLAFRDPAVDQVGLVDAYVSWPVDPSQATGRPGTWLREPRRRHVPAYAGASVRRCVLAKPGTYGYYIDLVFVTAETGVTIDLAWHHRGGLVRPEPGALAVAGWQAPSEAYGFVDDVRTLEGPPVREWSAQWRVDGAATSMWGFDPPGCHTLSATTPSNPPSERQATLVRRASGPRACFAAVMELHRDDEPLIRNVHWFDHADAEANADADADANAGGGAGADSENGPLEIEIDHAHGRDHWQLHTSGEPAITVDGGSYTVVLGQV
jgi:hypothetical protein